MEKEKCDYTPCAQPLPNFQHTVMVERGELHFCTAGCQRKWRRSRLPPFPFIGSGLLVGSSYEASHERPETPGATKAEKFSATVACTAWAIGATLAFLAG